MPSQTPRARSLRILDRALTILASTLPSKAVRRRVRYLLALRRDIQLRRYWTRPTTYQPPRYIRTIDSLLETRPAEHRFLFRMTSSEFKRLVERFEGDIVFQQHGKRPPAPPKYQLALFIHRLAHGYEVQAEARLFGVSGMSVLPLRLMS